MATQLQDIESVFTSMMSGVTTFLETLYAEEKIDPELYSKIMGGTLAPMMKLATQTVQQQATVDAQVSKLQKDILFVKKQELELLSSIDYNNRIKALTTYADMIGTMGAGGLVPSANMFTALFNMIQDLNSDATIPASTAITNTNDTGA